MAHPKEFAEGLSIGIIMDGNGRWAKKRGLPRTAGHAYGAEAFRRIGNYCKAIGIEYLTVYAFSTENWRRPPEEVRTIMSIFDKYMKEALSIMERDRFKMRFFGERSGLSPELQRLMAAAEEKSTHYDGCQMNLCINYGGRDEILHAVRRYAEAYKAETIAAAESEAAVFQAVYEKYKAAPQITRTRLLIETMERVLQNTGRVIVAEPDSGVLKILDLDQTTGSAAGATAAPEGSV